MSDDEEWKSSFVQGDDAALTAAIKAREAECDPLLRRGPSADPVKALALSLADPPYATRTAAVKDAATELVCKCMASASDIDAAIGTLSLEQCDVLMKYIYRGCARAQFWRRAASHRARAARRRPPSPRSPAAAAQARPQREGAVSLHFSPQMAPGGDEKSRPGVDHEDDLGGPAGNLERGMGIRDLSPENSRQSALASAIFARRRRAQRDVPTRALGTRRCRRVRR